MECYMVAKKGGYSVYILESIKLTEITQTISAMKH